MREELSLERRSRIGPARCALAAGALLCLLDLVLLGGKVYGGWPLVAACAALVLASGLLGMYLQLSLRFVRRFPRQRAITRSLVGAGFGLVVILPVSYLLFQGTGISTRWYAPIGPFIVAPLLFAAVAATLYSLSRLARRARGSGRLVLLVPVVTWGMLFFWADRLLYPLQYGYLHWALLLLFWFCLAGAAWLMLGMRPGRFLPVSPGWLALPGAALALLLLAGIISGDRRQTAWRRIEDHTHASGRLLEVARRLADLDSDHYSVILGERDCDNDNPRVHPFALEVPGNGVDEDCDGEDRAPPPPTSALQRDSSIDQERYLAHLAAWRLAPEARAQLARTAGFNVVLLVVDGLRADFLRPLDGKHALYPNLTGLLARSKRFVRAFSAAAGTDVGMTALLTGKLRYLYRGRQTLAQAFRDEQVRTYGVYQTEVERWLGPALCRQGLWGRKVLVNDPYKNNVGTRATSRQVTDHGIRFLRKHGDRRFMVWLHYFDVHEHHQIERHTLSMPAGQEPPEGALTQRQLYSLMLRHVDHHVGRFMRELEQRGLADETIVVLAADHGEGLAESPRIPAHHGEILYQPMVSVPLSFRVPGVDGGEVLTPASTADIFPTLLDLGGITPGEADGISLVPYLLDAPDDPFARLIRPIYMMESHQQAAVVWPLKLVSWRDRGRVELYNLVNDPGEQIDLAMLKPEEARRMSAILEARGLDKVDRRRSYIAKLLRQRAAGGGGDGG